eukprot:ctg_2416.g577
MEADAGKTERPRASGGAEVDGGKIERRGPDRAGRILETPDVALNKRLRALPTESHWETPCKKAEEKAQRRGRSTGAADGRKEGRVMWLEASRTAEDVETTEETEEDEAVPLEACCAYCVEELEGDAFLMELYEMFPQALPNLRQSTLESIFGDTSIACDKDRSLLHASPGAVRVSARMFGPHRVHFATHGKIDTRISAETVDCDGRSTTRRPEGHEATLRACTPCRT